MSEKVESSCPNEAELQIDEAIERLGLGSELISKCEPAKARDIVQAVRERFVEGEPRVWWLALKQPCEIYPYELEAWPACLMQHIPLGAQVCWLILESDSQEYPVYRIVRECIPKVLSECGFFEYYLVDDLFRWLVADTDHNEVIVSTFRG